MKNLFISIFIILTASCQVNHVEWQTLDFGTFKLKVPTDWNKFKGEGIDAYVGGLSNGTDSLWFYYGAYISGFNDEEASKYLFAQDTINGKIAAIKIPKKNVEGSYEMFIDNVTEMDKFQLSSNYNVDINTIFKIFKSLTFKNSDTTSNGALTPGKFREYPLGSGRTFYYAYCTHCHHPYKNIGGPALTKELINSRSNQWYYIFFKDRKKLQKDSVFIARQKEFSGMNCIELTDYSRKDIEQLTSYLKGQ